MIRLTVVGECKGGATNLRGGGTLEGKGGGFNTVKTLTFEKGEGSCPPPAPQLLWWLPPMGAW